MMIAASSILVAAMGKSERSRAKPQAAPADSLLSLDNRKRGGAKGQKVKETAAVEEQAHPQATSAPAGDDAMAATTTTQKTSAKDKGEATKTSDKSDGKVTSSSSLATKSAAPLPELEGFSNLAQEIENDMLAEIESLLSRKRAIVQPGLVTEPSCVPMSQGGEDPSSSSSSSEALYWKHMYEKLRDLRETEAERLLKDFTKHAGEREKALQDLIYHLQSQISSQQQQQTATMDRGQPHTEASSSSSSSAPGPMSHRGGDQRTEVLEAKVMGLKRQLLGYQQLTSFVLELDGAEISPPDGTAQLTRFNCHAINHLHKKAVKFQLDLPYIQDNRKAEMELDACFRPMANVHYLPDELKQEVTFETKQCPMLALELLRGLFENPE